MRDWSLHVGDPLSLTLSADMRLSALDYLNDHIWELELRGGEPPSLTIRTTYGLRARNMRLFYRFAEAGRSVTDPAEFHQPPRVRRFYPNFLLLDFVPVEDLESTAEYWVPESHVLAGRLTFVNRTTFPRHIELELCGLLSPLEGKGFGVLKHQMVTVLAGSTGGLQPAVFITGGPKQSSGPHPALTLSLDFDAGQSRTVTWACAAESSAQESFDLARRTAGRPWDAERARIELLASHETLEIYTGEPDWDAAFAFTQAAARGLLYPASAHLPNPSFVRARGSDDGYSRAGDGTDYPPSWSGQSPLDAQYLGSLLPTAADLRRGLLENFLSVQAPDGTIDGRPGLAGQRSKSLAPPLLATLAWSYYRETEDQAFLADAFPKLLAFFNAWFASAHDPDGDGIPEWDHVMQTGLDDNPLFDIWYPWSQSLGISVLSSPELESMLLREAASLTSMAGTLGRQEDLEAVRQTTPRLTASIAAAWNPRSSLYAYRDRGTGASWSAKQVGSCKGSGEIHPKKPNFEKPARLLIKVQTKNPAARPPSIEVIGRGASNPPDIRGNGDVAPSDGSSLEQSEQIKEGRFQWHTGGSVATTELVYASVERVVIEGAGPTDKVIVQTVDTTSEDITLFTPLWAGVPHPDHAKAMAKRLSEAEAGFNRPFGIPALPASPASPRAGVRERTEADAMAMGVHLPWNQLIGEGLLAYGFRDQAALLVTRIMGAVVQCLKQKHCFYERYHATTGSGLGERGALSGFAPLGLFLQTLGVQVLSPTSVRLEGMNPFPWPVTILYRGLRVVRRLKSTEVLLANAQPVTVSDPSPCIISL